jgi:uncharacterized protein (DUF2062 family)
MPSFIKKAWLRLIKLFKQGLSPRDLALSIVVSLLVTVFPFLGLDTIVLTSIALPMRLNLPIMIAISYIATPLKFLLLIPFINFGGYVFGVDHTLLTLESITESFNSGFFSTVKSLSYELLCGFIGWAVFAIPVAIVAFYILKNVIAFFIKPKPITD